MTCCVSDIAKFQEVPNPTPTRVFLQITPLRTLPFEIPTYAFARNDFDKLLQDLSSNRVLLRRYVAFIPRSRLLTFSNRH